MDPRLAQSSTPLFDFDVCEARLQLDSRFPWIVLIPRGLGLRELEDLPPGDLAALASEIVLTGRILRQMAQGQGRALDKLNVGALGNVVEQLHVHVVGRRRGDAAWPGPVWGYGSPAPYDPAALAEDLARARLAYATRPQGAP